MPAEKCDELLNKKLSQFDLRLNQIVGMTADGAAVMVKVGKLVEEAPIMYGAWYPTSGSARSA
jgi:hypothetical protein